MTMGLGGLDGAGRKRIQDEFLPGERLVWVGRPRIRHIVGRLIVGTLFAGFWLSVSLPIASFAWASLLGFVPYKPGNQMPLWAGILMALFSTIFPLIGVGMFAGLLGSVRAARRAVHAVTDRRLLTVGGEGGKTQSVPLTAVNFTRRKDHRDGRGTLSIGHGVERDGDGNPRAITMEWAGIADARVVERAILDALRDARERRAA